MKVIILKTKEVKEVSLGYAVNYLLPKKKAVVATKIALDKLKKQEKDSKDSARESKQQNRKMADKLSGKVVVISAKAGKAGKIHGSITKKEIAKELDVLKTHVKLDKPIKKLGDYDVSLQFGSSKAKVKVRVEEA